MAEITIPPPQARSAPVTFRLALRDIGGMTKRNLLRIIRTPQLLLVSVLQPAIILLLACMAFVSLVMRLFKVSLSEITR